MKMLLYQRDRIIEKNKMLEKQALFTLGAGVQLEPSFKK
jgi:hypothetical protein